MEGKTEYRRERPEVWDPITGWRPVQVHADVVTKTKRISGGSASQVLGSYVIPTGTFGLIRFLEISGNRGFEWSITDNRGTVWLSQLAGGATTTHRPDIQMGYIRGAVKGTVIIRAANSAAGTYTSTMDLFLESPQTYLTGTKNIRAAT